MKGNWDTEELLVHTPNQQQHQTIVEEQRQPLHSPTTPVWGGIADKIIKEESIEVEDKNNDSGISPDHCTSNCISLRSRQSSPNRSLSSGSDISQDTNVMHCTNYEYPRFVYKDCGSPEEFARHNPVDEQQAEKPMDSVCSSLKVSQKDIKIVHDNHKCPFCDFNEPDRSKFREHLVSHCTSKCDDLNFSKYYFPQLSPFGSLDENNHDSPSVQKEFATEHEFKETDECGLHVPRMNSQGKVKTSRCKQCDFVAVTKDEFWKHSRIHIKKEKLLTCPRCEFVTEYKHHLEYHLRNHFGSKPFKCEKCSYSCVNKSMLNSHLKSHSNVYQYRCADCSYATKYCHSLKLHLRKYAHNPGTVLNVDGSPNPLPIIDVYGTRRGPKQKSSTKVQEELNRHTVTNNNLQSNMESSSKIQISSSQVSPTTSHFTATAVNGINSANEIHQNQSFLYDQLLLGLPLPNHPLINENATLHENTDPIKSKTLIEFTKITNAESAIPEDMISEDTMPNDKMPQNAIPDDSNYFEVNDIKSDITNNMNVTGEFPADKILRLQSAIKAAELASENIPLDLTSKPEVRNNSSYQFHGLNIKLPKPTGTSRRKGKAVKLERRVIKEDTDEDTAKDTLADPLESSIPSSSGVQKQQQESKDVKDVKVQSQDFPASSVGNEFICQYCEIAFRNIVMYTMHMGYHDHKNPYTCNSCGHESTDKVSFFVHITRWKHS